MSKHHLMVGQAFNMLNETMDTNGSLTLIKHLLTYTYCLLNVLMGLIVNMKALIPSMTLNNMVLIL